MRNNSSVTVHPSPTAGDALRVGVLTPHGAAGADVEFQEMVGGHVTCSVSRISVTHRTEGAEPPTSPDGLRAHADPVLVESAAAELVPQTLDAIAYASTSTAYVIGPTAERELIGRLRQRWGIPVCSTPASVVDGLRHLGAERLAVVHPPWFGEDRHALGVSYFRDQGFAVTRAGIAEVADDPELVEPDEIVDWVTSHLSGDVDAVFLGGNGFRAAGAVAELEDRLGCPVLESNQVLLWSILLATGESLQVRGYGRLLEGE